MKTFLVPIDYYEPSLKALEVALDLAARVQAQLLLCHVHEPPVLAADTHHPVFALPAFESKKEALSRLRKFVKLVRDNSHAAVPLKFTVRSGNIEDELLELVKARKLDAVVMGTSGRTSFQEKLFGTTAEAVMKKASCPVLVIPARATVGDIKSIVYATALQPYEEDALLQLLQLKRLFNASLMCLYVDLEDNQDQADITEGENELLKKCEKKDIAFTTLKGENVADEIEHYLKGHSIDLLAFTITKHGFWTEFFHSSITSRLVQQLELPMLAIPKNAKLLELEPPREPLETGTPAQGSILK
jgi:nucleotide-binding universal stress UspA family protein